MRICYGTLYTMSEEDKIKLIAYLLERTASAERELSQHLCKEIKSQHFKNHGDSIMFHELSDYNCLIEGVSLPPSSRIFNRGESNPAGQSLPIGNPK